MNFIEDFAETIKNIQGFQPDLFAGATETELKAAEEKMNIMLPEDFKKFYRAFNGQNEYADALFDTFFLCSLKQILYFGMLSNLTKKIFCKFLRKQSRA